jgi:uncharacterized protein YijF (DUF1287 family)
MWPTGIIIAVMSVWLMAPWSAAAEPLTSVQAGHPVRQPSVSVGQPIAHSTCPGPADLIAAAMAQVGQTVYYDPAYVKLAYPGGDVPLERGVCTDVVIRALRRLGFDLQKEVHEDMRRAFAAYPRKWGLTRPDPNIDHRRVPNLMTFFARRGKARPLPVVPTAVEPGDLIAWSLPDGRPHIGIVTDRPSGTASRWLVVHNIGAGAQLEDVLLEFKIIGHYRLFPWSWR